MLKENKTANHESGAPSKRVEVDGYFHPDSMIRKVNREGVILLGGGHAILLQLAHPFVSAGVEDHSNFENEILSRLFRTVLFMHELVFENRQRADQALFHFHKMHQSIQGTLEQQAGRFPKGTPYSGTDPATKLWVHATFVDTAMKLYEYFRKPLSRQEREAYYSDSLRLAELLEIPAEIVPTTFDEFQIYMNAMLESDALAVTQLARRQGHAVLYPDVGFFPSISARLLRFVTAGLLPERFRKAYGLKWGRGSDRLLKIFGQTIRFIRPLAPGWIWQSPMTGGKLTYFLLWGRKRGSKDT